MADVERDLGALEARMDEHDRRFDHVSDRFDKLEQIVTKGFDEMTAPLPIYAPPRAGARPRWVFSRVIFGTGTLTGLVAPRPAGELLSSA